MPIHVLAISDEIDQRIYSPTLRTRMDHVGLVISCGDLPARYLEFVVDALDKPVYYVLGNHAEELTRLGERGKPYHPLGCVNIGGQVVRDPQSGLIMAGIPGSPRYADDEPIQYSEGQIGWMIARMVPRLLWNRWRHGRALDILVTHAPPRDVNDAPDPAHRGFKVLRRFLQWFRPTHHLHGHVHHYDRSKSHISQFAETEVVNVFPYQVLELPLHADVVARTLATEVETRRTDDERAVNRPTGATRSAVPTTPSFSATPASPGAPTAPSGPRP